MSFQAPLFLARPRRRSRSRSLALRARAPAPGDATSCASPRRRRSAAVAGRTGRAAPHRPAGAAAASRSPALVDRARAAGGDGRRAGREGVGDARHRHVGLDERDRRRARPASPPPRRPPTRFLDRVPEAAAGRPRRLRRRPAHGAAPDAGPRAGRSDARRAAAPRAAPRPATRSTARSTALGTRGKNSPPAAIVLLSDGASKTGARPGRGRRSRRARPASRSTRSRSAPPTASSSARRPGPRRSRPTPRRCAQVAEISGGSAFTAEDADALDEVYETLGSRIGTKKEKREISAGFAARGPARCSAARAFTSLRWRGRLP